MREVEPAPARDANPRLKEVYAHPVGRDAIDKILHYVAKGPSWVTNPVVGTARLGTVSRIARRFLGPGFAEALLAVLADHTDGIAPLHELQPPERQWWHDAVFYQVYPRSFADSDGDGIGDLRGIIEHLDYLADLGVDCLWLSPIFDSPNEDMGYDIRDYRAVMKEMGTIEDLDELIAGCHERGMRIILDLVVNHTSAEHAWFQEALKDPTGRYGDYYHLVEGEPGEDGTGTPPNNWVSFFGGSAWRWFPQAQRWGLHLFAEGQVDLNWESEALRREVYDIVQWWRARGVDGFRLDVINYISKRPGLPDGNEAIGRLMVFYGLEHYFFGPRLHEHLRELRREGFTLPDAAAPASTVRERREDGSLGEPLPPDPVGIMVGETPGVGVEMSRLLAGADRGELDLVFNFDVLESPGHIRWDDYTYELRHLKRFYRDYLRRTGSQDHIALFLENHDNTRMVSKVLGDKAHDPKLRTAVAKVLATTQLLLPGTPFIYQGQEIAAVNQDFETIDELQDVEAINRFQEMTEQEGKSPEEALAIIFPGARDHSRTPMRWKPGHATGFTTGTPWQIGREDSTGFTVAEQRDDPVSVLNYYRDLISYRRTHPALTRGVTRFVAPKARNYFGWTRATADDAWLVEINLASWSVPRPRSAPAATPVLGTADTRRRWMEPYECLLSRVEDPESLAE